MRRSQYIALLAGAAVGVLASTIVDSDGGLGLPVAAAAFAALTALFILEGARSIANGRLAANVGLRKSAEHRPALRQGLRGKTPSPIERTTAVVAGGLIGAAVGAGLGGLLGGVLGAAAGCGVGHLATARLAAERGLVGQVEPPAEDVGNLSRLSVPRPVK